jgi:hypothetical protein
MTKKLQFKNTWNKISLESNKPTKDGEISKIIVNLYPIH